LLKIQKKVNSSDAALPLVIVNPRSAGGATRGNWSGTAADLRSHFGAFSAAFTRHQGHAAELAHQAANAGRRLIIACGGDGTINEVANGILRSGKYAELGIMPSGTGGDFRRSLGIPTAGRDAAAALRTGTTKTIDVGKVTFLNFENERVSRYFLNVSSFGLASSIIERVKSSKVFDWFPVESVRGRANFAFSTLQEVLGLDPLSIRVAFDGGEERSLQTINFCVANARYFGGGMMIAPEAKLTDGMLDVVNIGDIGTAKIIANAHTLYRGTHHHLAEVHGTLARRIEVSAADPSQEIRIETDGELPGMLPALYEVIPAALRVRVPAAK
jgi:diacylglycerol kinase (ATP)